MSGLLSSTPISIIPSPPEIQSGVLSQRNLEIAVRALSRDGLVLLENMVDHGTLDRLNAKMVEDAYELQSRKDSPFNYNKGNIQQDPPVTAEWFSESIYTSKPRQPYGNQNPCLTSFRSHSDSGHVYRSRSQAVVAIHLRQHCASANARLASSISAHPQ
jgi:hypothetical protein